MPQRKGSAAVRKRTPRSADADLVRRVAARLQHISQLALMEADGPDPVDGGAFILDVLADLAPDLKALRQAVRRAQ